MTKSEATRRERIRNAKELHAIADRCAVQIKIVDRELRAGRLASAVSELLFVEMHRTDALKLKLARPSSMFRIKWLNGPIQRITLRVLRAVNDVSPRKTSQKTLDAML